MAFRELSYPRKHALGRDSVTSPKFCSSRVVADSLWSLLQTIESRLDGIYQLQSKILSSQFLLLQACELLSQCIVAQHLDPVLEIAPPEVKLERRDVDRVEYSQKVR